MKVVNTPEFEEDVRRFFSMEPKYVIMRFWKWITFGVWYDIRSSWQRSRRGYAECDVWGLSDYLNSWLPQALRELKSNNPKVMAGIPGGFKTRKEWDRTIEKMALGFEASQKIMEGILYPGKKGYDKLSKQRDEGLKLFIKHYEKLWD